MRAMTGCWRLALVLAVATSAAALPGVPSSDPEQFVRVQDQVFFTADDGVHGRELWCTDGTAEGTRLVIDFKPGANGARYWLAPEQQLDGALLFLVQLSPGHMGLFRTDGTPDGTQRIYTFSHRDPDRFAFLGGDGQHCYYNLFGTMEPAGLWATDGTPEGTRHVPSTPEWLRPIESISFDADGEFYVTSHAGRSIFRSTQGGKSLEVVAEVQQELSSGTVFNGMLYYRASASGGGELWRVGPTKDSQVLALELAPGPADGVHAVGPVLGGHLTLTGTDGEHGLELWRTDGTPGGAQMVADIHPGAGSSDPYKFTPIGEGMIMVAMDATHGRELWHTAGTQETTYRVHDLNPGPANSDPYAFEVCGDRLFFSALNADLGEELWVAEGTPFTARMVRDIAPGAEDAAPYHTTALGDKVLFAATSPDHGRELWTSDGTTAGTFELRDIYAVPSANPGSHPTQLVAAGNRLYFVASDVEHGAELWSMDVADGEPRLVCDIFPGTPSSNPRHLTYVQPLDTLFFVADDGRWGEELWQSDGTAAGTACVSDLALGQVNAAPDELIQAENGTLYFVAYRGPEAGMGIVRRHPDAKIDYVGGTWNNAPHWRPRQLRLLGGRIYFTADDGMHGEELWVALPDDARMVRDIMLPEGEGAAVLGPTAWNGGLYFSANDGVAGQALWRTIPAAPHAALAGGHALLYHQAPR